MSSDEDRIFQNFRHVGGVRHFQFDPGLTPTHPKPSCYQTQHASLSLRELQTSFRGNLPLVSLPMTVYITIDSC